MTNEELRETARMWLSAHLDSDDDIKTPWGQRGLQNLTNAIRDAYNAGLEAAEIARQRVFRLSPTAQERATWDRAESAMKDAIKALKLRDGDDANE